MCTCMDSMHYSIHYISITCIIVYIYIYILSNEEAKQNLSDCLGILDWQFKKEFG